MATKSVKEILNLIRSLGLEVRLETGSGHYKVHDPSSGAWLFNVSSSPSDSNWHYNIFRHLRRLGFNLDKRKRTKQRRTAGAFDLIALAKAQKEAEARGERIPRIEDIEDQSEFFKKIKNEYYTDDATDEVIDNMVADNSSRNNWTHQRFIKFFEANKEKLAAQNKVRNPMTRPGLGAMAQFVHIAINEVAPTRGIRAWKNEASGQQSMSQFVETGKASVWGANLIQATMDHIEGLVWKTKEEIEFLPPTTADVAEEPKPEAEVEIKTEPDVVHKAYLKDDKWRVESVEFTPTLYSDSDIRQKYAEVLLDILRNEPSNIDDRILERLDKLSGIA